MTPRRLLPVAVLAALAASCNWTDFDHLKLETPVRALSRPVNMDSVDYPVFVLPVTEPADARRLLVLGANNVALADFSFKPNGDVASETVLHKRFLLNGAEVKALKVAAYLPGGDGLPRIAAVTDDDRRPVLINLDGPEAAFAITGVGDALPGEATAIAVGDAMGNGAKDVVIAAGSSLYVLPDGGTGARVSCDPGTLASAVAVGQGWVVVSQSASPGLAVVVHAPYDQDADGKCVARYNIPAPSTATGFGTALVVADVDADSGLEIVASAPEANTVYLFHYADVVATAPGDPVPTMGTLEAPLDPGAVTYGTGLAYGVIEGQRTLLVADPGALGGAGVVWTYPAPYDSATHGRVDRPNADVQRFGSQVGVFPFVGQAGSADLLWTAADAVSSGDPGVVHLFFWVHDQATDPRGL